MKKTALLFFLSAFILSCSSDDDYQENPYLVNVRFSEQLDLSLPQYNSLNFPGGQVVLEHLGLNGVVVYNMNNSQYMAFELSDPNHPLQSCSRLQVNETEAICGCEDDNIYSIITGQRLTGEGGYPLKAYRIESNADVLLLSN